MKFSITKPVISSLLNHVLGAIDSKSTKPILKNIYMDISNGSISLRANNLEMEIVATSSQLDVIDEGKITLPGKKFVDIVRSLDESSELLFALESDLPSQMIVKCGRSRFKLSTLPANEYPTLDIDENRILSTFSVCAKNLKAAIDPVQSFSANNDVRYYLNGVFVEQTADEINFVATDGHRLACKGLPSYSYSVTPSEAVTGIILKSTISSIVKLCDSEEDATMVFTDKHVFVYTSSVSISSRLIDGRFPDYKAVIPKNNKIKATVDSSKFISALGSAKILSNEKYRGCELNISNSNLQVLSHNPEQEEADISFDVDCPNGELVIGANTDYLINAVKVVGGSEVVLEMKDASTPILINRTNDLTTVVVMPMRL